MNHHSRWGCQWTRSCEVNGTTACAPMLRTLGQVAAAIWEVDPTVPLFLNGLGQDYSNKYIQCGRAYPGMHWVSGWWCIYAARRAPHHGAWVSLGCWGRQGGTSEPAHL